MRFILKTAEKASPSGQIAAPTCAVEAVTDEAVEAAALMRTRNIDAFGVMMTRVSSARAFVEVCEANSKKMASRFAALKKRKASSLQQRRKLQEYHFHSQCCVARLEITFETKSLRKRVDFFLIRALPLSNWRNFTVCSFDSVTANSKMNVEDEKN